MSLVIEHFRPLRHHLSACVGELCPLCRGTGVPWQNTNGNNPSLRVCCGCLLSWPWESQQEYEAFYREDLKYHRDECLALKLPPQYERFDEHCVAAYKRLELMNRWLPMNEHSRTLDVGSSNGAFISVARAAGIPAIGLEPNEAMCYMAWKHHRIALMHGDWFDIGGRWHLIVATDVIEHLTDPEGMLRKCRRHGAYLYIETPDFTVSRPPDWKHIKPREHICLFSEDALVRLLARTAWRPVAIHRPIEGKLAVLCGS